MGRTRQQQAARMRQYRRAKPEHHMYANARRRAREQGLAFDLTPDYVRSLIAEVCPILGVKFDYPNGVRRGTHPYSLTLDRVDLSKGYVQGNVQVISGRANIMKSDASPSELLAFARWIRRTYG